MKKLGILDWGIGGLGLYKLLKKKNISGITYFSDSGFEPYGKVPINKLIPRVQNRIEFLKSRGCDSIAIACNAAGVAMLQSDHFNVVKSGLELINNSTGQLIGVIGGEGTIRSAVYEKHPTKRIIAKVAQPLSAQIEAGSQHSKEALAELHRILTPLQHVDSLLLACTHYPAMSDHINDFFGHQVEIMDPSGHLAQQISDSCNFQDGSDEIFTTGDPEKTKIAARLAFGVQLKHVNKSYE